MVWKTLIDIYFLRNRTFLLFFFPFPVPDYYVTRVYDPKLHKRSAGSLTRLSLNVFGRDVDLLLNPIDGILAGYDTPVYIARRNVDGENIFEKIDNVSFQIGLW